MDWSFLIKNKESINVTTDSRKITPGCVFVALKGEHFDGNDFVPQAKEAGAAYIIQGEHAVAEFQDLARAWRRELGLPILGITGTNGKTTTKELCAAVLRTKYNLHYTQGNLNNQLGVPMTLCQLTRHHEMAIVEMGASHPGDIRELVEIAEPNYGLITNVGRAHLEGFGSFEGVQQTKRELYDYIVAHDGFLFRNADNPYLEQMYKQSLALGGSGLMASPEGGKGALYHTGKMLEGTHLVGDYNSENVQAAIAVGEYFGVSRADAEAAIRAYVPTNNRSQLLLTDRNTLVVDAYNANPTSMQAAINAFYASSSASNDVFEKGAFILGGMRELGEYSHTEHQNIANMLLERKADRVLLVGPEWHQTTAPYPIYEDANELGDYLKANPLTGFRILVKGSRSNKLETIIPLL